MSTETEKEKHPSHEQIEERAYQLYLDRESKDGSDVEDWFEAERELESSIGLGETLKPLSKKAKKPSE